MISKPFTIASFAIVTAVAGISAPANADPVGGAAIGAGVGALAGHAISGRDGALVGGAVGAVAGYQIAKHRTAHRQVRSVHYRPVRHYHRPVRVYQTRPY